MVYSVTENGEITHNSVMDIKEHLVNEYYSIVPRYWTIDGFGVINSKKPIKVTENNSLICYDETEKKLVLKPVSEYLKNPENYYLILRAPKADVNQKAVIENQSGDKYEVTFDYITGFMLAVYLKQLAGIDNIVTTRLTTDLLDVYEEDWEHWFDIEYEFYKKTYNSSLSKIFLKNIKPDTPFKTLADTVITKTDNRYTIANEIFYSTNLNFIVGILEALINTESYMVHEIGELITDIRINPSVYTNCLNMLFANYSITRASYLKYPKDYSFSIKYTVSPSKYDLFRWSSSKVKKHAYTRFIDSEGNMVIDNWDLKDKYINDAENPVVRELAKLKYNDEIKFIRFDELIVSKVRTAEPEPLYDLIMGNGSATNYLLGCAPWAKNSDGDVLAVMAVMTKEGLKASEKIMMSNTERLKDGTDPDKIRNWIQKDAVVGLYQATKGV